MQLDPLEPSALSPLTRRSYRIPLIDGKSAWLCGLAMLVIYLWFPNRINGTDGVDYATAVKSGTNLFHPHHVLYNSFCFLVHRALGTVHFFDPLRLMTTLSSLTTAATVALLAVILGKLTQRPLLAALCALAYGASYGTFFLGTTAEVYPYAVLCELIAVGLCLRTAPWRESTLLGVAFWSALAMLFHQTALFFAVAMIYWILRQRGWGAALRFCLYCGLCCGLPYVGAAYAAGVRSPAQLVRWLFFYVHTPQFAAGEWGSGLTLGGVPLIIWGFVSTIVTPAYEKYIAVRPLHFAALDVVDVFGAIAMLALIAALGFLVTARAKAAAERASILKQTLWLWLLQQALFTAWWNQSNCEFWYMLLPPLYILGALRIARTSDQPDRPPVALLVFTVSLTLANLCGHIYLDSRPENSAITGIVDGVGCARLHADAVFVGPINDLQPYVLYACGQPVHMATIADAPPGDDKKAALQHYAERLFAGQSQIFLVEPELDQGLMKYYRSSPWSEAEVRAFYQPYVARAPVVGRFTWFGRSWQIYELR